MVAAGKVTDIRKGKSFLGTRLDEVKQERIQWRSRGRFARGKITILDGDPGLGKSTLLMDWAARVSQGLALPDGDPQPERGVLLICAEDDPADTIAPRLRVMEADLTQITLLTEVPYQDENGKWAERMINLPDDVELIERIIQEYGIGLVIVDPLVGFLREDLKANSDQDIRTALQPLAKMLQRTGASAVLVRHLNKGASANSLYRGGGSIGIIGIARFGLMVVKDPKDAQCRILAATKSNLGPPAPSLKYRLESVPNEDVARVVWMGEVPISADELLSDQLRTDEQKSDDEEAEIFLLRMLEQKPETKQVLAKEAKEAEVSWRSVCRVADKMKVRKSRQQLANGTAVWLWHLPGVDPSRFVADGAFSVGAKDA